MATNLFFRTRYHNAPRLDLPSHLHTDFEVIDHVLFTGYLNQPSTRFYAFPNTPWIGLPEPCYAKKQKWEDAIIGAWWGWEHQDYGIGQDGR